MLELHKLDEGLDKLNPHQRFVFEYGRFLLLWNDFTLLLDTLIWHLKTEVFHERTSYSQYYQEVSSMPMGQKQSKVIHLLRRANKQDVIQALSKVDRAASRNEWVHGALVDLSPIIANRLLRVNPDKHYKKDRVTNLELDSSPFEEYREALNEFWELVMDEFNISGDTCWDYLVSAIRAGV